MMRIFLSLTLLFCCGAHMSAMNSGNDNGNKNNKMIKISDSKFKRYNSDYAHNKAIGNRHFNIKLFEKLFLKSFDDSELTDLKLYFLVLFENPITAVYEIINRGGSPIRRVSFSNGRFNTALWIALDRDYTVPDLTNLLLEQVDFRNNKSEDFHYETIESLLLGKKKSERKIELINKMIKSGINLCIVDKKLGWNHLHRHVFRPPLIVEIAKKFIENGVNINLQGNQGNTPTHLLARSARGLRRFKQGKEDLEKDSLLFETEGLKGLKGMLKLFRKNNADFSIENYEKITAYEVAMASTKDDNIKYGGLSCPQHIAKFFLP